MDRNIVIVLVFALSILGPTLIIAAAGFASISALGRNPSAAPKIFTGMVVQLMVAVAIEVIALLILFQLYS